MRHTQTTKSNRYLFFLLPFSGVSEQELVDESRLDTRYPDFATKQSIGRMYRIHVVHKKLFSRSMTMPKVGSLAFSIF